MENTEAPSNTKENLEKRKSSAIHMMEDLLGKPLANPKELEEVQKRSLAIKEGLFMGMLKIFPNLFGEQQKKALAFKQEYQDYFPYQYKTTELYHIGSFLKGDVLDVSKPLEELKAVLSGKKILIIGDDHGSLSEILKILGADVCGVEYSKEKVDIAHSGVQAESHQPQMQVIQGDAWDLADSQAALYKEIEQHGPYDMIYSYAVLNGGSGFVEGKWDKYVDQKEYDNEVIKGFAKFFQGVDGLLGQGGIQLHDNVSDKGRVVPYPYHGSERFYYMEADPNLVASIKENIVAVLNDDEGSIAFVKGSPQQIAV
ncbi:MAG: class I SAM-dependent methyltransferase [Candidatus Taylorbacteria bacterium]|nr:class I SAM-dependent methyltransferase [Candidatus Taylorbacteria bacterium]